MNNKTKYTPKDIVEQKFSIPLYQRLFAWTPREVKKLLYDLKEHFESNRFLNEQNPYYLGMLTTIERDGYIDLIDGQQRFTVMMLLAICFKEIPEWNLFLNNGKRLKLVARTEDEEYLSKLATQDKEKGSEYKYENVYMKNALDCIREFLEVEFSVKQSRVEYALNIYNYLTFFISELPPHYIKEATSLNKYFEVLNSTGKGLEQHEILKVELLKNQSETDKLVRIWNAVSQMEKPIIPKTDEISNRDYAELYKKALNNCRKGNFEEALQYISEIGNDALEEANTIDVIEVKKLEKTKAVNVNERQDSIISFPEFLLFTLDMTLKCDGKDSFYQKDKLIERFDKNKVTDVKAFYNNLLYYRLLLDYYVVRRDVSNGQSRFIISFRDDERENRERLRQYLSMLTVSTEFYIWLKPYMEQLLLLPHDWQRAQDILRVLKDQDDMRRKKDGYPKKLRIEKYPHIDRYWFWRLDYYLWERRKEFFSDDDQKIVDEYVFRTNRSIEHLHPQDETYNDSWDNNITNGFGNLAMISQSFNSIQSNDNIRVKFARIQEQLDNKSLQSLKMLVMYRKANDDHSKWTEELAKENLDTMCTILEKSFGSSTTMSSEVLPQFKPL